MSIMFSLCYLIRAFFLFLSFFEVYIFQYKKGEKFAVYLSVQNMYMIYDLPVIIVVLSSNYNFYKNEISKKVLRNSMIARVSETFDRENLLAINDEFKSDSSDSSLGSDYLGSPTASQVIG